jgi:hypothetical protein
MEQIIMPNKTTTAVTAAPVTSLKAKIENLVTEFAADARRMAVLLSQHHRDFEGEVECQAVIKRVESILVDAGLALENVGASLRPPVPGQVSAIHHVSPRTLAALDTRQWLNPVAVSAPATPSGSKYPPFP